MIKISESKKKLANVVASVSNLINNILRDYNQNIIDNDKLALLLDYRVSLLEMGYDIDKITRTHLINKAMDVTKTDPYANPGMFDPLMETGQFIIRKSLLPTKHKGLDATLWKVFQADLAGSRRRHAHKRDHHLRDTSIQVLSMFSFITPSVIFPEEPEKKLEHKPQKKLSFRKQKKQESQKEAS